MTNFPVNFITLPRRRFIRGVLIIFGLLFVVFGFLQELRSSSIPKTLWVIDNSLSMTVADIKTSSGVMISRLDLAKQIIRKKSEKIDGEQAIMTAAQGARLELPMTSDRFAIANVTDGITAILRGGGSSLATPLETIRLIYGGTDHLRIIWMTDGGFSDSGSTTLGSELSGIITFVGVGTRLGGPILLGYNSNGLPQYKESEGSRVNSVRDDTSLSAISDSLDAEFVTTESDAMYDLELEDSRASGSVDGLSLYMVIGVFFIIVGLIYPRYQYPSGI